MPSSSDRASWCQSRISIQVWRIQQIRDSRFELWLTHGTGNYATDVAAGASYRFRLLFIILVSNLFAIFLQSLCVKLGTVTGMNLAENCRAHLPKYLNWVLYGLAEAAIIATDIAEVRKRVCNRASRLTNSQVI